MPIKTRQLAELLRLMGLTNAQADSRAALGRHRARAAEGQPRWWVA